MLNFTTDVFNMFFEIQIRINNQSQIFKMVDNFYLFSFYYDLRIRSVTFLIEKNMAMALDTLDMNKRANQLFLP